ncbi:dihydrofolate reductase family protein [Robertmurraya sp.]|jgi:dihydrofolate reductase|uniref:dihydrofolate reductase family protein n=1 Tax=Robertmurraya sp. TaxID=2837525 RepID=UPI003703F821
MNRKVVLFIATSLDGYIATNEESLDWLFQVEGEGDNGYSEFYETVDTILMGRRTFDWVMNQVNGQFPYVGKESFVFSRSKQPVHDQHVKFVADDVIPFINKLKAQQGKSIWLVGGGDLIHSFLKEKLVDELTITVAPVLLGAGIPLFKEYELEQKLELKGIKRFNQFVELHYMVKR